MAKLHYPTRMAKSCLAILDHPQGISGLMIDFNYFISSGRNEVNDLINNHDVHIIKTEEKNKHGTGTFTVYRIADRSNAEKVIKVLNGERMKCGLESLTQAEIDFYLSQFKEQNDEQE
ncbi:hypothetical protein [Frederiksenia canicola]